VTSKNKKLRFSKSELIASTLFLRRFQSNDVKQKEDLYLKALENINKYTDLFTVIKNSQDLVKLKYIMLNEQHIISFPYLSKPILDKINDSKNKYSKSFNFKLDHIESIKNIYKYFNEKFTSGKLDECDVKIFEVLDPKIRDIIKIPRN